MEMPKKMYFFKKFSIISIIRFKLITHSSSFMNILSLFYLKLILENFLLIKKNETNAPNKNVSNR